MLELTWARETIDTHGFGAGTTLVFITNHVSMAAMAAMADQVLKRRGGST
jgi:hypothetical protein